MLHQQLKVTAADNAAKRSGQETQHGHNVKAHQPHESTFSLVLEHSEAAGAQTQTGNGLPALQRLTPADNGASAVDTSDQIPAGLQSQHSGQHTHQACSRPHAL